MFEPGTRGPDGGFFFVKNPSQDGLLRIYELLRENIGPDVAPFEVVRYVYGHNPISFWGVYRSTDEYRRLPKLAGFVCYLPLNAAGLAALNDETLDTKRPNPAHLAKRGEEPVALYLWAIVGRGLAILTGMLVGRAFGPDLFERLPMFGSIGTQEGLRALKRSESSPEGTTAKVGTMFEIRHPAPFLEAMRGLAITAGTPAEQQKRTLRPQLETMLAATPDHMAKVMAIRAAVFMAEQNCPYEEEFDGNDYAGAQILGTVNGSPAAVLRIRYFAEFVKLERLAVLPRFRRTLIAKEVIETAIEICRRKGYKKMYGQAQTRLVPLWARFGFKPMAKNARLVFSDHEYVEIMGDIAPHENPLTPNSDPLVLIRPEGKWDVPGVLDQSAARPPTNPH